MRRSWDGGVELGLDRGRDAHLFFASVSQQAVSLSPSSSGPQNCAACVHEGIYEEGISILESSSVSEQS